MRNVLKLIALGLTLQSCNNEIVINKGVCGYSTADILEHMDRDLRWEYPDFVILMIGNNDMIHARKKMSIQDYSVNLKKIVIKLKSKGIKVILLSSPPIDTLTIGVNIKQLTNYISPNIKLDSVRKINKQLAIDEDLFFVDLFQLFIDNGIPKHNEDEYIKNIKNCGYADGVHPTEKGYKFIAEAIFKYLVKNDLINEGNKIITLGDSITFGPDVKGAGTSEGNTYPGYLLQMIKNFLNKNDK